MLRCPCGHTELWAPDENGHVGHTNPCLHCGTWQLCCEQATQERMRETLRLLPRLRASALPARLHLWRQARDHVEGVMTPDPHDQRR